MNLLPRTLLGALATSALVVGGLHAPTTALAAAPAATKYGITTTFDGNNTVTGSARNVGGSWYLSIQQRSTRNDSWQALAGGPQRGKKKQSAPQLVRGDGFDFHGLWRTCVTTNWQKPTKKTTCGSAIRVP